MSEKKKKYLVLIFLVSVCLFVRLSVLVFSPYPILNDIEEVYRAHAAEAILKGGYPFRLFDYQYIGYMGGYLPVISMTSLSFLFCGVNHFSFRIPSLIIGTVEIAFLYLFLHSYFNRRIAIVASLLFIVAPFSFLFRALRCFGDHRESVLFIPATAFIFYKIFFGEEKRRLNFILLGIISGFATYCCYISLITLVWIILLWFIFDKKFFLKKDFLLFVISFLVGFSPGIYYELTYNFRGISWLGELLKTKGSKLNLGSYLYPSFSILSKIKTFLGPYLISALRFRATPYLNGWILGVFYYSIFIVSFLSVVWSNRKPLGKLLLGLLPIRILRISPKNIPRESPFFIYMGIFFLIFVATIGTNYISDLQLWKDLLVTWGYSDHYYRYLMPFYIFIFILISIFLDRLWKLENRSLKLLSFSLLVVLISIGLIGNIYSFEIDFFKPINKIIPFQEDKSMFYNSLLGTTLRRLSLQETVIMVDKIKPEEKDDFYLSLGIHLGHRFWENSSSYIQILKDIEPKYRTYLCQGINRTLIWHFDKDIGSYLQIINRIDPEYRSYFYKGLYFLFGKNSNMDVLQTDAIAPEYRDYFYQGLGLSLEWRFGKDINTYIQMINKIPPEYRGYFYQGLGRNTYWRLGRDISAYIQLGNRIEDIYRGYFYRGWVSKDICLIYGDSLEEYIKLIHKIDKTYRHFIYQGIKWGLNHQSIKQTEGEYFDVEDAGKPILYDLLEKIDQATLVTPKKGQEVIGEGKIRRAIMRIGEDKRLVIFAPSNSKIKYNLRFNERSVLSFSMGVTEEFWKEKNIFLPRISIESNGKQKEIFSKYLNPSEETQHQKWFDYEIDLSDYIGKEVILSLETYISSRDKGLDNRTPVGLCWGYPQINYKFR